MGGGGVDEMTNCSMGECGICLLNIFAEEDAS